MSRDNRGVYVARDDLVVWYGMSGSRKKGLHLGVVEKWSLFGKIQVGVVRRGQGEDRFRTTGVVAMVKKEHLMVIDDAPESPYE